MDDEIWVPVPLADFATAYDVSNYGRVRTKARVATRRSCPQTIHARLLSPGLHPYGYKIVCLKCNGLRKMERIHKLVALAFIPNPYGFSTVNHIDADPANNYYKNLEWCDQEKNMRHAVKLDRCGRKLDWEAVREIRALGYSGESCADIGRKFGVTTTNVSYILRRKIWKDDPLAA